MKRIAKFVLLFLSVIASIGIFIYIKTIPLEIETYTIVPKTAELYFTEKGYVKQNDKSEIFSVVNGEIISINVNENQVINKGDIICVVDSSQYNYDILKSQSGINSYKSQQQNLDLEEKKQKDSLIYNKQSLQSEYDSIVAQQNTSLEEQNNLNVSTEEKIRLQNIIIEQSKSNLKSAQHDFDKAETLLNIGTLSQTEYDKLKEKVDTAKANLDSELQQLEIIKTNKIQDSKDYYESMKKSLEAKINGIDNSLNSSYSSAMYSYYSSLIDGENTNIELLNKKINDCTIKSPVSGTITTLNIKNSNIVNSQTPIAIVKTDDTNEIEVYISTKNIENVKIGNTVELIATRQSGDIKLNGQINKIDDEAVNKLSALGVEERKVRVTIKPEETKDLTLNSGFDIDVKFNTFKADNKITVPKTAVFKDGNTDKDMIWIVSNNKIDTKEVKLGLELRTEYIIEQGLTPNDIIIKDADIEGLKKGVSIKTSEKL